MTTKMTRTLLSLPDTDMRWLKSYSQKRGQSVASVVREAVAEYRTQVRKHGTRPALRDSAGLWKGRNIDALKYVSKLRAEWE